MQIKISGHMTKITPPLRDYVQGKITKLEEFFKNIQKVEVILDAKSIDNVDRRQVVEIRAWMAGYAMIQASEGGKDMYAAFDMALDEAKRQIERHKDKMTHEKIRQSKKGKILSRKKSPGLSLNLPGL